MVAIVVHSAFFHDKATDAYPTGMVIVTAIFGGSGIFAPALSILIGLIGLLGEAKKNAIFGIVYSIAFFGIIYFIPISG